MKKALWLPLSTLLLGISSCNSDPAPPVIDTTPAPKDMLDTALVNDAPQPYFLKKYAGTIDGNLPVEMVLVNWGDGFLSGRYWYKEKGNPIELSGELIDDMNFQIVEYVKDKETGTFKGLLTDPTMLTGIWSNPAKSKNLIFEFHEIRPDSSVARWNGNWHLNEIWDKGTLLIGNVKQDSFDFALTIVRSSHTGAIEGQAVITGNKARFSRKEFEQKPCVLLFELKGDTIRLEQPSSNFDCGFGARAYADGIYERRNLIKRATLGVGLDENAVFPTPELHDTFVQLTGEQVYELFAFNMQVKEIEKRANGLTVVKGAIPGLFRTNEAIIVFNKFGTIWAATLDVEEATNEFLVRYFTNDPASKGKLHHEVQNWREGFKDYRLIF